MKNSLKVFLIIFFFSCTNPTEKGTPENSPDPTDTTALHHSMKGFDLYAWEKDGSIFFNLLPGTNRDKTSAEIYDPTRAVQGMSAIEMKLNEIDTGEYILIKAISMDTGKLKPLIDVMKNKNLKVSVIQL